MTRDAIDFKALAEFFPPEDLEWRIGQANTNRNGGITATVLAYLTNRAIMDRLDAVVGPDRWKNEYRTFPSAEQDGMMCGISILMPDGEWVTKWDAAPVTKVEPIKGAMSDSMKRAAVHWGIGRYLYDLPKGWANISEGGTHYAKTKEGVVFHWDAPAVPAAFWPAGYTPPKSKPPTRSSEQQDEYPPLPPGVTDPSRKPAKVAATAESGEQAKCPICGGAMWDNRTKKTNPRAPDWKCKDKDCEGVWWPGKWPPQPEAPMPDPDERYGDLPF